MFSKSILLILIVSLMILFIGSTLSYAAEENILTTPFPTIKVIAHTNTIYCSTLLGTELDGTSKDSEMVIKGYEKAVISAKAIRPADKIVIEISKKNLYMASGDTLDRDSVPFEIVENSDAILVAMTTGFMRRIRMSIITLNYKTGVGSLTTVMKDQAMHHAPRIEAMYLTCSDRK